MNFTKEDFEKIAAYLRRTGIRDTELLEAESTLDNTSIPVVQDGENRQMSAQTFVEQVTVEASEYAGQFKTVNGEPIVGEGNIDAQEVYYCAVTDSTIRPVSRTTSGWAIVPNEAVIPAKNKWYVDVISGKVYYYNGNGLTEFVTNSGTVTGVKIGSDGNVIEPENGIIELPAPQEVDLSDYVVQEDGKGLSTNDYTDADKTKLQNLPTADGLIQQLNSKANDNEVVKGINDSDGNALQKNNNGIVTLPESSAPDLSGYATTTAMNQAIEDKLTEVSVAAISETDAKFFIRDGALCISTENFVTVTVAPVITKTINSDGTATVTITDTETGANIEYSLDGGTTWQTYSTALTINTAGTHTVMARAQVSGKPMSDVVTETVTLEESSMPTLTTTKTSSDVTLTASGNGTVAMTVDGTAQTSPYTVNRTSSDQTLSVVVTNKEANKLIATLTLSVTVPKITVVTAKIYKFCKRVLEKNIEENSTGNYHLIFGEDANTDWAQLTAAELVEGYTAAGEGVSESFDLSQVTNAALAAAYEATQEKYDEHTLLLGVEPEVDFLGYKGTRASVSRLYSANSYCDDHLDADNINYISINDDGLLVTSNSGSGRSGTNIRWTKFEQIYSKRFSPDSTHYDGGEGSQVRDFKKLYIHSENGFINNTNLSSYPDRNNLIISGFPNVFGSWGHMGRQQNNFMIARGVSGSSYGGIFKCVTDDTMKTLVVTIASSSTALESVLINGTEPTDTQKQDATYFDCGAANNGHGYASVVLKANSPTLILMY